jgi:hypothetical protein
MAVTQNRHVDQWKRTDVLEISACSYSHLNTDKDKQTYTWEKRLPLQQVVLQKLDEHM